jgi:hypothetical protein
MKLPAWYDKWLTDDVSAEEIGNYCETCGEDLAVSVDPEGSTVYCRNCEKKHDNETSSKTTIGAATASTHRYSRLGAGNGGRPAGI